MTYDLLIRIKMHAWPNQQMFEFLSFIWSVVKFQLKIIRHIYREKYRNSAIANSLEHLKININFHCVWYRKQFHGTLAHVRASIKFLSIIISRLTSQTNTCAAISHCNNPVTTKYVSRQQYNIFFKMQWSKS